MTPAGTPATATAAMRRTHIVIHSVVVRGTLFGLQNGISLRKRVRQTSTSKGEATLAIYRWRVR